MSKVKSSFRDGPIVQIPQWLDNLQVVYEIQGL